MHIAATELWTGPPGVVPVLIGPLQVLLAMLPAIVVAIVSTIVSLLRPSAVKALLKLLWRLKLQVAAVVLIVVGLWYGLAAVVPSSPARRVVGGQGEAGRDWPVFRGDLARTGSVAGSPDPTGGGILWRYTHGDEAYLSSPAVVGNRVYFTTAQIRIGRGKGRIVCLDADTGKEVWTLSPKRYDATFSSPAIRGEYLVVGEGLHTTTDARVLCVSLAPGREGEILWSYETQSHVESTPVIYDGKVYVGAGDKGGYYCFALEGDGRGGPKILWRRHGDDFLDAETSLVAADGRFYAGLGNDGQALVELDADTGEQLRRIDMPYPVFSPPAIVEGKLYVGCGNGDFAKKASELNLPAGGKLVRVDLQTFTIDWSYDLPDTVLGSPAVGHGKVFAGCRNGELFVLSTEGRLIRRHATGAQIMTSPALGEETVYVVSTSGMLQAFDVATGRAIWQRTIGNAPTGTQFGYISSPAVARGHVYLGTQADGLVCAGEPERIKPVWSSPRGGDLQGCSDGVPLPASMEYLGQFPPSQQGTDVVSVRASPAVMGSDILVPLSGAGDANGLACLRPDRLGYRIRWHAKDHLGVQSAPVAIGDETGQLGRVVFVTGAPGAVSRKLRCVDANGSQLWARDVHRAAGGELLATSDALFVQTEGPETLTSLSLRGEHRWTVDVGPLSGSPRVMDSMLLCPVTGDRPEVVVLDAPTGAELFRQALPAGELPDLLAHRQTILALTDRGVLTIDPTRPDAAPRRIGPPAGSAGTLHGDTLWLVSAESKLLRLDLTTGETNAGPDASPDVAPLIVGEHVVFLGPSGEIRILSTDGQVSPDDAEPIVPGGMSWLGRPTTPLLAAGGRLHVGLYGWGICTFGGGE